MVVVKHGEVPGGTPSEIRLWRPEFVMESMMGMMLILDPDMMTL